MAKLISNTNSLFVPLRNQVSGTTTSARDRFTQAELRMRRPSIPAPDENTKISYSREDGLIKELRDTFLNEQAT